MAPSPSQLLAVGLGLRSSLAFPGPTHLAPEIHFVPSHLSDEGGWHDVAGASTHNGVHHVFMGQGWNHHVSSDLVSWSLSGPGPQAVIETYGGMWSYSDPCSGFITKDPEDSNRVCAGFRQCGSEEGNGPNPWDALVDGANTRLLVQFLRDDKSFGLDQNQTAALSSAVQGREWT